MKGQKSAPVLSSVALAVAAVLAAAPVAADDLMDEAKELFKPIPSMVPAVKDNAVTREKVDLGRMLFFDPRLSASHLISSATGGPRAPAMRRPCSMPCSTSPSSGTAAPRT